MITDLKKAFKLRITYTSFWLCERCPSDEDSPASLYLSLISYLIQYRVPSHTALNTDIHSAKRYSSKKGKQLLNLDLLPLESSLSFSKSRFWGKPEQGFKVLGRGEG